VRGYKELFEKLAENIGNMPIDCEKIRGELHGTAIWMR
jgi:hypothetical protein